MESLPTKMTSMPLPGDLIATTIQKYCTQTTAKQLYQKTHIIAMHCKIEREDTSTTRQFQKRTTLQNKPETSISKPLKHISKSMSELSSAKRN